MSRRPPQFAPQTERALREELLQRARAWLPGWEHGEDKEDFGKALFAIVARIEAEVTQRLNRMGEKNLRGFLHWLGVRGAPAQAAGMPVVFSMTRGAPGVSAPKPVRLQAPVGDTTVVFETQQDLDIVPAHVTALVAANVPVSADNQPPPADSFFVSPDLVAKPTAPQAVPTQWNVKSFAAAKGTKLQLDPGQGLEVGTPLLIDGAEYRVSEVGGGGISGITPALRADVQAKTRVTLAVPFDPFGPAAFNQQEHALYIGDDNALNIEGAATIRVKVGGDVGLGNYTWAYSAKVDGQIDWRELPAPEPGDVPGELVLRKKNVEPIEKKKLGAFESRWLRVSGAAGENGRELREISLRINCGENSSCNKRLDAQNRPPRLDTVGFANTTPLVMDEHFYPFGPEPRRFDAFYLSSPEAFSKERAAISICVGMVNPTLAAMATAQVPGVDRLTLFAIGQDNQLHRLRFDAVRRALSFQKPLQPPLTDLGGTLNRPTVPLSVLPGDRPAVTLVDNAAMVAVPGDNAVWLWTEHASAGNNKWLDLGEPIKRKPGERKPVRQVVVLSTGASAEVYALCEGRIRVRNSAKNSPPWADLAFDRGDIVLIAPVMAGAAPYAGGSASRGLIAVNVAGEVYQWTAAAAAWTRLMPNDVVDTAVVPLAVVGSDGLHLAAKAAGADELLAWREGGTNALQVSAKLLPSRVAAFDFLWPAGGDLVLIFVTEADADGTAGRHAAWWLPFAASGNDVVYSGPETQGMGTLNGAPTAAVAANATTTLLVPGDSSDVLFAPFELSLHEQAAVTLVDVFEIAGSTTAQVDDLLEVSGTARLLRMITGIVPLPANRTLLRTAERKLAKPKDARLTVYRPGNEVNAKRIAADKLEFKSVEERPAKDSKVALQIKGRLLLFTVTDTDGKFAKVSPPLSKSVHATQFKVQPLTKISEHAGTQPSAMSTQGIHPKTLQLMQAGALYFSSKVQPQRQRIVPMTVTVDPGFVLLDRAWIKPPTTVAVMVTVDAAQSAWTAYQPQTAANPELSWEYFDGSGWWKIDGLMDGTAYFLHDGEITFCLPSNIAETEVGGRRARWIRARLVGGDYGQPAVTVTSETSSDGKKTTQTVDRDTDAVRAPLVLGLDVRYEVCCPVKPQYVLTRDNGSLRDQSIANRTGGSQIDFFTPLRSAVELDGRALFVCFDAPLRGAPVTLLFIVEETPELESPYPLTVEILRSGRYEPVLAEDGTRGLTETGIVALTIPESPTKTELFGVEGHWLRIKPNHRQQEWAPRIRSIHVNAAMARAVETQLLELLGSSDGSPNMSVRLARSPVVARSLRLRVREALSDEEEDALNRAPRLPEEPDAQRVVRDLGQIAGKWVLWREVDDPLDEPPEQRVYSLDDAQGIVRFGDGAHGLVPRVGRDVIMAERYERSGDARANDIAAWSAINLVTPLAGVEAATIPVGAAGGADAQKADAVMRTAPSRLQHRDRALTLRDMEQLALESSSDIVQARAITTAGGVCVVAVGRAPYVRPKSATLRALRSFLQARSTPELMRDGALKVVPPELVPVRIEMQLQAVDIESFARLAKAATEEIVALFDPFAGGSEGAGWKLGTLPDATDIAARLAVFDELEGIPRLELARILADRKTEPLPARLRPDQLITVSRDDVDIAPDLLSQAATT